MAAICIFGRDDDEYFFSLLLPGFCFAHGHIRMGHAFSSRSIGGLILQIAQLFIQLLTPRRVRMPPAAGRRIDAEVI